VSITEMDGEVTHANNYSVVPVRVLDQRRRVLVLAAAPDPDVATVRQILQEDRNVDLIVRVQKTRGAFYEGTVPDDLSELNAIVLAGYPGASADRATLTRIRAFRPYSSSRVKRNSRSSANSATCFRSACTSGAGGCSRSRSFPRERGFSIPS